MDDGFWDGRDCRRGRICSSHYSTVGVIDTTTTKAGSVAVELGCMKSLLSFRQNVLVRIARLQRFHFILRMLLFTSPVEEFAGVGHNAAGRSSLHHEAWHASARITARDHDPLHRIRLVVFFAGWGIVFFTFGARASRPSKGDGLAPPSTLPSNFRLEVCCEMADIGGLILWKRAGLSDGAPENRFLFQGAGRLFRLDRAQQVGGRH